ADRQPRPPDRRPHCRPAVCAQQRARHNADSGDPRSPTGGALRPAPAAGGRAVSYTHLDVYKRQTGNLDRQTGDRIAAVSYTHLDVYKRQGLYRHTYIDEYDTPGGEPIAALISSYEFDASAQDVALMRNISKVSAAAHMPFIGSAGPAFFLKDTMEEVAAIKDIGNYFDRAEYIKWKSFRDTDDSRYLGLVMPRVLGRLPYGPDTVPVRSFNYIEEVKGPDHDKYLWTNASFAFAANMVKSFIHNGWCVQIRGPQSGGAV
ncbi:EvpB/family type VI secretion protein, partial [Pluralibacter gergoviae]